MAPSFGSMSMTSEPNLLPPAAMVARTDASSSAANVSFGFFPAPSIKSKCWPMRANCAFGKRWRIRTFSDIGDLKCEGRNRRRSRPLQFSLSTARLVQRARLDLHARPHGGGDRDALDVGTLGAGGLGLADGVSQRLDVGDQLVLGERGLADAALHDAGLLDAELDRAALGALHRRFDVHGHGADLRVRHHAARTEHLTEA